MLHPNLQRAVLDPAFPGAQIYARISGLHSYLVLLEEFIPHMQAQVTLRFAADLKRRGIELDDPDLPEELSDLQVLTKHHIAGNFHGAFVLALSAELEASVHDLAEYVRVREQSKLSLNDLREPSTLRKLALYIETLLREPLQVPSDAQGGLKELQLVRNILAHANGSLAGEKPERIDQVVQIAKRGGSIVIDEGYMLVHPAFIQDSLRHAEKYLAAVIEQVERKYPLSAKNAP